MSKILITDSYSLNTGDVGILFSMIDSFRKNIPDAEISVEASHPEEMKKFKEIEGIAVIPRIFNVEKIVGAKSKKVLARAVCIGVYDSFAFILWAALRRIKFNTLFILRKQGREQAKIFQDAEIVVSVGGGFLSSYYNYFFRLLTYSAALILGKKIFLFAQSIGPFYTKSSRVLIPFFLNRCELISLREPNSFKYLNGLGIKAKMALTADMAFLLEENLAPEMKNGEGKKKYVSFCVKSGNLKIKESLLGLVDHLIKKGFSVRIISQTQADDKIAEEISAKFLVGTEYVLFGRSPKDIKAIYAQSFFVVSNRMHAIIFAAEKNIPFLSISYEPKFKGLIEQLDYPEYLQIEEEKISQEYLIIMADRLIENRENISRSLSVKIAPIKEKSRENIELLNEILRKT